MAIVTAESARRPYLIERILPAYAFHLLVGSSGAGKTTLLYQILEDFTQGRHIFGYQSHPCPWLYISADRTPETTRETIIRTGAKVNEEQIWCMVDARRWKWPRSLDGIKAACNTILPRKQDVLLVIDGLTSLFEKPNDHYLVAETLMAMTRFCREHRLTILGCCLIPKVRESERIMDARQQVLGAVTWAAHTESVFLIEPAKQNDPDNDERHLTIMPRNDPTVRIALAFDTNGKLIETEAEIGTVAFDVQFGKLTAGQEFQTAQVIKWAKDAGVTPRTANRWISEQIQSGMVKRIAKGRYKKEFTV